MASASIYTLVKIRCSCVAFEKELLVYPYVHVVALFQNAPCCNEFFLRVGYLRISAEPVERFFLQNWKNYAILSIGVAQHKPYHLSQLIRSSFHNLLSFYLYNSCPKTNQEVLPLPANRTYKDSLFSLYLSDPQRLIEVYNAIADTDYPPDTPVQMNTLEDVLFKNQINDLSFELDNQMVVLIEHQSTVNENMALRLFLYCARVYEKILKRRALYKKKRVMLSVPRFIVLYNGKEDYPEHGEQYLSESYKVKQENLALELKVDIYNINYEKAPEIIARSKSLNDYSLFVHTVKMGVQEGRTFDEAVEDAVVYCIRNDIMKEFLELHGSEVSNMLLSEWNMDEALEVTQEEAFVWPGTWHRARA